MEWQAGKQAHPLAPFADVIAAVNFASQQKLTLAIRGGGHNGPGLGTCEDGLVVDLGNMKGIHVDPHARTVRVEGGCIWGDSSLAGQRSRFDIAFRREMKRVIPDIDKPWKQLPATHPLFAKCYFPDVKDPPPGINFHHEPVYALQGVGTITNDK